MNYEARMKAMSAMFVELLKAERERTDWRFLLDEYAPIMARLSV